MGVRLTSLYQEGHILGQRGSITDYVDHSPNCCALVVCSLHETATEPKEAEIFFSNK